MEDSEIRLRCVEAAARNPDPRNSEGMPAAVLAAAKGWYEWVTAGPAPAPKGVRDLL